MTNETTPRGRTPPGNGSLVRLEQFHAAIVRLRAQREALIDDFRVLTRPGRRGEDDPAAAAAAGVRHPIAEGAPVPLPPPPDATVPWQPMPSEIPDLGAAAASALPGAIWPPSGADRSDRLEPLLADPEATRTPADREDRAAAGPTDGVADASREPRRSRTGVLLALLAGAAVVIVVAAILIGRQGGQRVSSSGTGEPAAGPVTAASDAETRGGAPPRDAGSKETATPEATGGAEAPPRALRVELTTLRPVWLRALADGRRVVEALTPAERTIRLDADSLVQVRAGDAGAVRVQVNGAELGVLGRDGQVVNRRYEAPAAAAPTR